MRYLATTNNAQTTLNGAINNTTTTVVVTDGSVFPVTGGTLSKAFMITVEDEIMIVTGRSTNTLTVLRGQEGTTAASHSTLTPVYHYFTAGSYQNLQDALVGLRYAPFRAPVKVATHANITLSGEQTIGAIAVYTGDWVLVKDQSTASQNGIYEVSTSAWTKLDTSDYFAGYSSIAVMVTSGTYANTILTNLTGAYTWSMMGVVASSLTTGHFLKADSASTFKFAAHGLTNSDVGAAATIHNLVDTTNHPVTGLTTGHVLKATGATTYAFGTLPAHNLIDTTGHTVSGLTTGHFLKATGATSYAFGAHGLDAAAVGAVDATLTTGSFTPTLYGTTTAGTPSYDGQVGTYVRMGRLVYFSFYILLNSLSGAAGTWRIGGLPVAVNTISGVQHWTLQGDTLFNLKPVRPVVGQTYLDIKQDNIRGGNMAVSTISAYLAIYCTGMYWSA